MEGWRLLSATRFSDSEVAEKEVEEVAVGGAMLSEAP